MQLNDELAEARSRSYARGFFIGCTAAAEHLMWSDFERGKANIRRSYLTVLESKPQYLLDDAWRDIAILSGLIHE